MIATNLKTFLSNFKVSNIVKQENFDHNKIPAIGVLLIFVNVFNNTVVFLKFSHMSYNGSEVDSKYNIHPSFVIVI